MKSNLKNNSTNQNVGAELDTKKSSIDTTPIITDLRDLELIGAGGFGKVFVATRGDEKTLKVAVKYGQEENSDPMPEISRMSMCDHPNIVHCHGKTNDNGIVMEYMDGGDLRKFLKDLSWNSSLAIAFEVAKGLAYIHSLGYVHRDLKSLNVLINSQGEIKISDLGSLTKEGEKLEATPQGSPYWQADEVHSNPDLKITKALDVFSFGIFLGELLTRDLPKMKDGITNAHQLLQHKKTGMLYRIFSESKLEIQNNWYSEPPQEDKIFFGLENALKALYTECTRKNPDDRPKSLNNIVEELSNYIAMTNLDVPTIIKSLFVKNEAPTSIKSTKWTMADDNRSCYSADAIQFNESTSAKLEEKIITEEKPSYNINQLLQEFQNTTQTSFSRLFMGVRLVNPKKAADLIPNYKQKLTEINERINIKCYQKSDLNELNQIRVTLSKKIEKYTQEYQKNGPYEAICADYQKLEKIAQLLFKEITKGLKTQPTTQVKMEVPAL